MGRTGPRIGSTSRNTQYAIRQLDAEELLATNKHPYVVAHYGEGQVHEAELACFRRRLQAGGTDPDSIADPVALHRAARAMGGDLKPWGKILRSLLDGSIAYSISGDAIDRILISASDAAAIRSIGPSGQAVAMRVRHVSQRDAAEILNLPFRHAYLLPSEGTPGGSHRIPLRKIRHLARTRITLAELSARTGIQSTRLEHRLEKDGCPRHDALGWLRREALAKIVGY